MDRIAGLTALTLKELRCHARVTAELWRRHRASCYACRRGQHDATAWCEDGYQLAADAQAATFAMRRRANRPAPGQETLI